ncbi:HNH endonuclease [Streptomyces lavendulae]|uniref:HNH endonuclease n=1 Tax=Streptomyces lavendulae TaxID=1914 RepID=UPI0036A887DB
MMIMMRAVTAAAAAFALSLPATAAYAAEQPAVVPQVLPMGVAVGALPLAVEDRTGYQRTSLKHWNAGANPTGGCNTRAEVLIAEAVVAPEVGPGCTLTGGVWWSYYDEREVTPAPRSAAPYPRRGQWPQVGFGLDGMGAGWALCMRSSVQYEATADGSSVTGRLVAWSAAAGGEEGGQSPAVLVARPQPTVSRRMVRNRAVRLVGMRLTPGIRGGQE